MISISKNTLKKDFLTDLARVAHGRGEVTVVVDSLPSFLNTEISVSIFLYQISTYPRKVVWTSSNPTIFTFLGKAGMQTVVHQDLIHEQKEQEIANKVENQRQKEPVLYTQNHSYGSIEYGNQNSSTPRSVSSSYGQTQYGNGDNYISNSDSYDTFGKANYGDSSFSDPVNSSPSYGADPYGTDQKPDVENPKYGETKYGSSTSENLDQSKKDPTNKPAHSVSAYGQQKQKVNQPINQNYQNFQPVQPKIKKPTPSPSSGSASSASAYIPNNSQPQPANLIDQTNGQNAQKRMIENKGADLDKWLEKIDSAKSALNQIKHRKTKSLEKSSKKSNLLWKIKAPVRNLYMVGLSLVISFVIVGAFVFFPTNAYTVEVKANGIQTSTEITVAKNDFKTKSLELSATNSIETSGTKELKTTNATGKVAIINKGGYDYTKLSNGRFYLYKDGKKYKPDFNNSLSKTVTVPSRNDLYGPKIEFTITAVEPGSSQNQSEDSKFSLTNLYDLSLGSNLYAIATTPITASEELNQSVVTQTDLDILKASNDSSIVNQRVEEIKLIQDEQTFTDPTWYSNSNVEYSFDRGVGDIAEKVTLTTTINSAIYYLPTSIVQDKIQKSSKSLDRFGDVVIKGVDGDFAKDEEIVLDVYYSYYKDAEIDELEIKNILENNDYQTAIKIIKEKYPSIEDVEIKEIGIKIPGIKPRNDLNLIQN